MHACIDYIQKELYCNALRYIPYINCKTMQRNSTAQSGAFQYSTRQQNTIQYNAAQYSTVHFIPLNHHTCIAHCRAVPFSTLHCITMHYIHTCIQTYKHTCIQYIALHCIALHCITLHCNTLHYMRTYIIQINCMRLSIDQLDECRSELLF